MESATLTPGGFAARLRAVSACSWARAGFALLCLATTVGFVVYPTFPNYDSYYSLLWGRELLAPDQLSFDAYRAPTEHPLAVAFGAALSLLGDDADRVLVGFTLVSFVALVAGLYRLGRVAFTPLVGTIAALLLLTRFDFPFLAARGYVDIPYLALVIWAAALEAQRPRRGMSVLWLLTAAGLLRPEGWVLAGLYFLWIARPVGWSRRAIGAGLAALAPLVWAAVDLAATGDPLFSLNATSGLAEELGRRRTLAEVPTALPGFIKSVVKPPVAYAGLAGLALAAWIAPRRAAAPAAVLLSGVATFVAVGLAGLSVIERYLLGASLAVLVFAAVALGGFTMLREGTRLRRWWALGSALLVVYGLLFTITRVNLSQFETELTFRGDAHAALERVLADPDVRAGLRCGPLSVPNHKLIPDARWVLGASAGEVLARSDPRARSRIGRGVALFPHGRLAVLRHAYTIEDDDPLIQRPDPRFAGPVAISRFYAAYVRC